MHLVCAFVSSYVKYLFSHEVSQIMIKEVLRKYSLCKSLPQGDTLKISSYIMHIPYDHIDMISKHKNSIHMYSHVDDISTEELEKHSYIFASTYCS